MARLGQSGFPSGVDDSVVFSDQTLIDSSLGSQTYDPSLDNSSSGISQPKSLDELIAKIKSTSIYQTVYKVFSSSSNSTYWLGQLQAILDSIAMPDDTFLDRWNWSQGYDDKVAKIYNEAIASISQLYAKYQEHVNSLPSTAVQQDAIAGINSAITGNIHGSTLSGEGMSVGSAYDMQSTNALEGIGTIADFALNATSGLCGVLSGFADVALKFRDLDLRRGQLSYDKTKSFAEFSKLMSDSGVILNSKSWDELDELDPDWRNSSTSRTKALYNAYNEISAGRTYGPVVVAGINEGYGDSQLSFSDDGTAYQIGGTSYGVFLEREYSDLGKMQLDLAMAEAFRRVEVGNTNLSEGLTSEEVQQAQNREIKANSSYNARKAHIFLTRLESLVERSNNHDPIASVELINMMQNADWQESAVYLIDELAPEFFEDLGTTLYNVSSWNSEQFHKVLNFLKSKF